MKQKFMIGDKIYAYRKDNQLLQSQLGKLCGVSNKAVSKWETYEVNPDITVLPKLAKALGVTVNDLLCEAEDFCSNKQSEKDYSKVNKDSFNSRSKCENVDANINDGEKFIEESHTFHIKGTKRVAEGEYEFTSNWKTKKGTPLLHINLSKKRCAKAKGIIAIGNKASGIFSFGLISTGVISIGLISIGLISIGLLSLGLLIATGLISIGVGVSVGCVAVGLLAVGLVAVGIMSVGLVSVGCYAYTAKLHGIAIGIFKYFK